MAILAMIGRVGQEQAALRMSGHGWKVVEEVVGMWQDDWTGPLDAVVISSIINPNGAERSVERAFTAAGKEPDSTVLITNNSPKIVIGVGRAGG